MSCTKLNDFYRGDTVPITITITQNDVAVDITGSTITIMFKVDKNDDDSEAVIEKDAVLTDPTNGEATITLTPTDTDVDANDYVYDIRWTNASGAVRTLLNDSLKIIQDINQG